MSELTDLLTSFFQEETSMTSEKRSMSDNDSDGCGIKPKKSKIKSIRTASLEQLATESKGSDNALTLEEGNLSDTMTIQQQPFQKHALRLAAVLRSLDKEHLYSIGAYNNLNTVPVGTVMEVSKIEQSHSRFGPVALLSYYTVDKAGIRIVQTVTCPKWIVERPEPMKVPSIAVYMGKSVKKNNQSETFHDLRRVSTPNNNPIVVRKIANDLRLLSINELMDKISKSNLSDFPEGTVFITEKVEFIEKKETTQGEMMVVHYTLLNDNNKTQTGRVFVPIRLKEEALCCVPGILVYKGMTLSHTTGRIFVNAQFLTLERVELALGIQEQFINKTKEEEDKPELSQCDILAAKSVRGVISRKYINLDDCNNLAYLPKS